MALQFLVVYFVILTFNTVSGYSCGGLLEGERGHFSFANVSNQDQTGTPSSPCLWIIQLHYKANIRFNLDALAEDLHLNVYPEYQVTSCNMNDYTKLNSTHVGRSLEFPGKTLIIVLSRASASFAFSWEFFSETTNNSSGQMKNSDFVDSPEGLLEWVQLEITERVTWAITSDGPVDIKWNVHVATSSDEVDSCAYFYFAIFQLNSQGILREAVRTCGYSSDGHFKGITGRFVVLIRVNSSVGANNVSVSWGLSEVIVTDPPVTKPPVPTATGYFAATTTGLIAVILKTGEAASLTNEFTLTVAVNHKLKKVYWAETPGNSRISRSNFDGSGAEAIVQPTGDTIHMLAIDEQSGNVYFALIHSHEITVCNSLGKNCSVVISNSSLANQPIAFTLDSENALMYWSSVPDSLVRANMDGSNATVISTGFQNLYGLVLDKYSDGMLYWADGGENAIGTIDTNDCNKLTLVTLEGTPRPFGIQVDAQNIYFSNFNTGRIQSVEKNSGTGLTTIFNATQEIRHLALFSADV